MAIAKKLEKFLKENKIKAEPIEHRIVYTAYDKAQTLRVSPKIVGKTLVVKLNGDFALVLIPANKNLDKKKFLKTANKWRYSHGRIGIPRGRAKRGRGLRYSHADFVKEAWIKKNLKGVKVGAVPPFGNLWKMPTFIDRSLINQPLAPKAPPRRVAIIINGGDWNWSIKINPGILKKTIPDLIIGNISKAR